MIVGVKKCGTSSLQMFLASHPQIKFQRMYADEGHYFTIGCFALSKEECLSQTNIFKYFYSAQKESENDFIFEKSPNYFNTLRVAEIIKLYNKNIKIIVITCEPAARAYSDYLHLRSVLAKNEVRSLWTKPPLLSFLATRSLQIRAVPESFEDLVQNFPFQNSSKLSDEEIYLKVKEFNHMVDTLYRPINQTYTGTESYYFNNILTTRADEIIRTSTISPLYSFIFYGLYSGYLLKLVQSSLVA